LDIRNFYKKYHATGFFQLLDQIEDLTAKEQIMILAIASAVH